MSDMPRFLLTVEPLIKREGVKEGKSFDEQGRADLPDPDHRSFY
jgi:hypothetical protein